ncbi:globin domain-containing protein [Sphingomonas sp. BN140010]|uniref:Globin domain-containing protein n=1 Tax=Sphingomonas arvum TaxID=2992113 RepID=A0ABT3JD63_9SPHN|nr:globin family protein [Sphingomonas sp. BN140010]MCW3796736.1 globin domain-containing protein [Sphingomonas sp. BN140010]
MTPLQIDLVQDSFALIVPRRTEAAAIFYERLFVLAPETRALFKNDLAEQGRKLMQVLVTIVRNFDDLGPLLDSVDYLAQRHVGYGVRDEHYAIVGEALIETLRECLGVSFDERTERAWGYAYTILSGRMIRAAREWRDLAA